MNSFRRFSSRNQSGPGLFLNKDAFSLWELLAVVTIIGLLGALVAPSFQSSGTNALTAAGSQVSELAMLARNDAITHNSMTALTLVGNAGTDADYRAFAIFELPTSPTGAAPISSDWQMISRWEYLPNNITVDVPNSSFALSPALTPPLGIVTFRGQSISAYCYQVFLPDGRLLNPPVTTLLRLVQGSYRSGQMNYSGTPGTNYYNIIFLGSTGRLKIVRP